MDALLSRKVRSEWRAGGNRWWMQLDGSRNFLKKSRHSLSRLSERDTEHRKQQSPQSQWDTGRINHSWASVCVAVADTNVKRALTNPSINQSHFPSVRQYRNYDRIPTVSSPVQLSTTIFKICYFRDVKVFVIDRFSRVLREHLHVEYSDSGLLW